MHCPNVKSPEWKNLVEKVGEIQAWREFFKYGDIPKTPGILKSIRTRSTEDIAKGINDDLIRNEKEIKYTRFIQSLVLNKLGDISPTKPLQMKPAEAFASAKESFGKAITNIDTFLNTISSPELFNVLKSSPERFAIATSRSNLQNVSTFDDVLKAREQYQYIIDNFDRLKEFAIVELAHTGLLIKKDKIEPVDPVAVVNDSTDENDDDSLSAEEMNTQKFDANIFETNFRDSASPRLRALVQTIKTGEYELGIPLYASPSDVMVDMMYAGSQMDLSGFTDSNTKLNAFIAALGARKEGRPYLNDLLDKIIGKNGYVETGQWDKINDILTFTSKAYANESLLLYKLRKQGGDISGVSAVKTIESNRDQIKDQVSRDWLAQHKNSDFFKRGATGEYFPKAEKVKQLNTIRKEGMGLSGFDQQVKFQEFFNVLGVNFTTDDVSFISARLAKALRQGKGFEVIFQDKGLLDNIYNSFVKNIDVPFKDQYGFQDEKRSMHAIAQLYYDVNPGRWNIVSSRTADGKSKYLYIQPSYLEVLKREWENGDGKSVINSALAKPNADFWNKVKNNIYKFTPSYFSGSREQEAGKDGIVRKNFTEKEHLVTMFLKHQESMDTGTYIMFNLSDKTTTAEVKMTKEFFQDTKDVPVGKGREYTIQNNKIDYTPAMKQKVYNTFVEPEVSRILAAIKFGKDVNLENFATASKLFYFMPKLNSDPMLEEFREKLYSGDVSMEELKNEYADVIADSILDEITNSASLQIGKYINNKIFKVEDNGEFSFPLFRNGFADTDYVERFRKTGATGRTLALLMVMDMKLNYMNAQVKTVQYLKFDPMVAFKAYKGFNKATPFEEITPEDRLKLVNGTWDEFSKRAAAIIAPGGQGNWHWKIGGEEYGSSTYRAVTGADVNVDGMEITDAQEFVTMQEHIDHLMSGGKLDAKIWKSIHDKIVENGPGGYYDLDGAETKALFSATKPVYVGSAQEGPDEAGLSRVDYVKSSRYPLIPSHEKGSERDKLRIWMEKNNIQSLNFASGKKLGRPSKSVKLFDVNGVFIEPSAEDMNVAVQTLSRDSLRTQQEIPHQHDTIATITQMNRTLFDGLLNNKFNIGGMKNISGQNAKSLKEAVRARMFNLKAAELQKEMGDLNRSHRGIQKLLLQVMKEDTTGSYTENDMRALELNDRGFFRVALESQFKGKKLQGLINSMINKNVMLKADGASFIQVSGVGARYNFSSLSKGIKSEIIWTKGYAKNFKNVNVGLDYIKLDPQTKKVTAAQVIVSQYLRDEKGKLIDLSQYITETNGVKILDTSKFSPEMFQLVASRIPNQSLVSTLPLEVVGFLPHYMENIVIVPDGITGQMGSDFDVDKLYTYIPKMVKNDDGNFTGVPYELNSFDDVEHMNEEQLSKLYRDIHWEVLTQSDTFGAITKTVDNPEVKEKIKERDQALAKYGISVEKSSTLPLDFNTTIKRYNDNRSGKSGVSIYASLISAQADMQDKILRLGTIDAEGAEALTPVTIKLTPDGKPLDLGFIGRTATSTSFVGEVRTISDNINMQFTEAVDNAKNQFLHEFNWDQRTMAPMGLFSMLSSESGDSVPIEMMMELTSQRSIEKLLEGVDMKQDSFGDFDLQAIKTVTVALQDNLEKKIDDGNLLPNGQVAGTYLEDESRDKALDPITLKNMWLVGKAMYDGGGMAELKSLAISGSNKQGKLEKISKDLGFASIDDMLLKYYTVQYDALNLFSRLEDMGRELMTIIGSMYVYTKGIGKDVFATKQKLHQLNKFGGSSNFLGIENIAGRIERDEHGITTLSPQGEIGASIQNSLLVAQSIHQNLFPISTGKTMENLVQRLLDNRGQKLESLGKQSYYDLFTNAFNAVRSYMYTIPELELFDNPAVTRNKLINGETSIGNRILQLRKDPTMVKNGFLKNLDIDVSSNGTYVLDFKAPFGTDLDEKAITSGFYELAKSENEEVRQLAKDLAIYPYATGDAGNMGRFIPVEYYFSDKDFALAIHQLNDFFVSHLASDDIHTNILMDQIVQNDPARHARKFFFASSDMSESTFKKILKPLINNADTLENVKSFTLKVGDFSAHKKGESLAKALQVPLSDREIEAAELAGLEPYTLTAKGDKVAKSKYPPYILINDSFTGMYTGDQDYANNYLYKRVSPALNPEGTGVYERINILGYKNIKEFEYDNPGLKSVIKDNAVEVNDPVFTPEEKVIPISAKTPENTDIRQEISEKLPSIVKETAKKHLPKELFKTRQATQFIGDGGNTDSTTNRIKTLYSEYGLANTGKYTTDDIVMVASNGARSGAFSPVVNGELQGAYKNIDLAIKAGARIIMDTAAHLESSKKYNVGEWALAEYMAAHGYEREDLTGMWSPKEPIKSEIVEDGKVTKGINISSYETGLGGKLTNFAKMPVEFRGKKYSSAEEAYQQNKGEKTDEAVLALMKEVILAKLTQHPDLVIEITNRGGSQFLDKSTHNLLKNGRVVKEDRWTGQNGLFMLALRDAYMMATQEKQEEEAEKITPDETRVVFKNTEFIIDADDAIYYADGAGNRGALLKDKAMISKVLLSRDVLLHPESVVTLTDMQHSPSYFVLPAGEIVSLNPSSFGKQITSEDVWKKVMGKLNGKLEDKEAQEIIDNKEDIIEASPTFTHKGITVKTEFQLSEEQATALRNILDFLDKSAEDKGMYTGVYTLEGYAGTGKTSIIGVMERYIKAREKHTEVIYMAPTHAATVALGLNVVKYGSRNLPMTVQSAVREGFKNGVKTVAFTKKFSDRATGMRNIIVLDEASMLANDQFKTLVDAAKKEGHRVIFMGDPKQIPEVIPGVEEKPLALAFANPNKSVLNEVFRTKDNNILTVLTNIRNGINFVEQKFASTDKIKQLSREEYNTELISDLQNNLEDMTIINYTNEGVYKINKAARRVLGFDGELQPGEKLIGYLGSQTKQIEKGHLANSVSYMVTKVMKNDDGTVNLKLHSKLLKSLLKQGMGGFNEDISTTYLQMSENDSLNFNLSEKQMENNKKLLASELRKIHDLNQAYLVSKSITYQKYVDKVYAIRTGLAAFNTGNNYIYNPTSGEVELYDKTIHTGRLKLNANLQMEKGVDFGYGITVHKSQGMTIPIVYFDTNSLDAVRHTMITRDGKHFNTEKNALYYVGMSRASEKLVVPLRDTITEAPPAQDNSDESEEGEVFDLLAWAARSQQDGAVEELFGGSPDAKTILNRVYQNTSEPNKQILMLVGKSPFISAVNIVTDETISDPGEYHPGIKTIKINPTLAFGPNFSGDIQDARKVLHEVILHELLHHATSDFLNADQNSLNAEQKKWVVALKMMFSKVQNKILNDPAHRDALTAAMQAMSGGQGLVSQKDKNLYYGLTNVNEFVSMIMSNEEFREFMNNTPYEGDKSFFERFLEILAKILESLGIQIKEGSVLKEAIGNIVGLVNSRTENDSFELSSDPIPSMTAKGKLISDNLSSIIETLNIKQIC